MAIKSDEVGSPAAEARKHGGRIFAAWFVASVIGDIVVWFVWGPHMAPGFMTSTAAGQVFDFKVLTVLSVPVLFMVWIYGGYSLIMFRDKGTHEDGYYVKGNRKIQATWYTLTGILVIGLAAFGTYELIAPAGAGVGEGPSPIWKPNNAGHTLVVQVIAQQWRFTYRWPQFGGMETTSINLPVNTEIQFDVTSLDVIHDFWAYQLGVKADANPEVNNVAYTKTLQTGRFVVRCDELCGIWHGAMYNYGHVVSQSSFYSWAHSMEAQNASLTKLLPKFSTSYLPKDNVVGGQYFNSSQG
ncbi:MAG: hypothetical protein ACP5O0_05280 [Acidimicrobiales bacterium]